jgi:hypothetical protein
MSPMNVDEHGTAPCEPTLVMIALVLAARSTTRRVQLVG